MCRYAINIDTSLPIRSYLDGHNTKASMTNSICSHVIDSYYKNFFGYRYCDLQTSMALAMVDFRAFCNRWTDKFQMAKLRNAVFILLSSFFQPFGFTLSLHCPDSKYRLV
jgi:hypothetical protein